MITPPTPPLRWILGVELARARAESKLSMTKAAALVGVTKAKIANIELGRQTPSAEDIRRLLTVYGAEQRSILRLTALAKRTEEANWWTTRSNAVPRWFTIFAGLERLADREFVYEPHLVPGLLQTPEYAAAVTAESLMVRADRHEDVVKFREARGKRLTDPDGPLTLHCITTKWALEMAIGTPDMRRAQLEHLVKMASLPTVTIQILRPEDGTHAVHATGAFVILEIDSVSKLAYVEMLDDAVYLTDRARVATYQAGANDLQRVALSPARSLDLVHRMIADL